MVAAVSRRRRCSLSRLPAPRCAADATPRTWERPRLHRADVLQPRCSMLTTDSTPAITPSCVNLGAQGGLDFLYANLIIHEQIFFIVEH
jgi:hypothetical protein